MTTQQKQYFSSIDLLRGSAALVVAFYHYTNYFLAVTHPLNFLFARGYLGVEAFFVISGLVIPYSLAQKNYSIRQFWNQFVSRVLRIEGAYWASILIMLLIDASAWFTNPSEWLPGVTTYRLGLHFFHANALMHEPWLRDIYWTLAIDWQFYLCVLLVFPLLNRREWWVRYPLYALFAYRFWATPYEWLPYHLSSFGAGVMLFHYYMDYLNKKELAVALPIVLWVHYHGIELPLLVATALPCAVILFIKTEWIWAKFVGKISYSFYLTHTASGWLLLHCAAFFFKDNGWIMGFMVFVAVLFSLLFAKYFYDWVEEPTLKWVKNWQNRNH